MSLSRSRWFGVWIGIELTILCFLPLIIKNERILREPAVFYMLAQAFGSFIILICGSDIRRYDLELKIWLRVALLLKLGAAPFHFWYPYVAESLDWIDLYVFITFLKLPPLVIIIVSDLEKISALIYISAILTGLAGGAGAILELRLRKLIIYSSLNHLGWIILAVIGYSQYWDYYFFIYCIIRLGVVYVLQEQDVYYLFEIEHMDISWDRKYAFLLAICSLGGLPPFLGFIPKWVIIESTTSRINLFGLTIIIYSSVITLYFYLSVGIRATIVKSVGKFIGVRRGYWYLALWVIVWNGTGFWLTSWVI